MEIEEGQSGETGIREENRNKRTSVSKARQKINGLCDSGIFHVSLKCLKSQDPVGYKWHHLPFSNNRN